MYYIYIYKLFVVLVINKRNHHKIRFELQSNSSIFTQRLLADLTDNLLNKLQRKCFEYRNRSK